MSGLGDLLGEAEGRAAREAGGARLDGDRLDAVHTTVRRAHSRRAALRTGLVAVAAVVVGGGLVYGVAHLGGTTAAGVADSPASSATPSASPSLSTTVPAMPAFAGTVTVDPHLPTAQAITPEVWASAGPGWALVSYREQWEGIDTTFGPISGPQVIYLVSPAGDRYELANVAGDTVSVLAWRAGSTTAAVSVQPHGDAPHAGWLNLVSGAVAPSDGYAPYVWALAFLDADGAPVWTGNDATSAYVSIAPDGTQSEFTWPSTGNAAEVAVHQLAFPGIDCAEVAPYDAVSSIVVCWDNRYATGAPVDAADAQQAVVRVWPADNRLEVLHESTYATAGAQTPTRAGEHVVASTGNVGVGGCPTDYSVLSGGKAAPVPGWDASLHPAANSFMAFGATDNVLTWGAASGCSGDETPIVVMSSDLDAGTYSVLVPFPSDRPKGEDPYQSVTGVAVAH